MGKNYSKKIMAAILTFALLISCAGIKTTAFAASDDCIGILSGRIADVKSNEYTKNTTAASKLKNKAKVLFIGNSMTFYNNTPYLFQEMAGKNTVVNYLTCGSQCLYNHGEWIHKVLESNGIYKNFEKNCTTKDMDILFKKGSTGDGYYKNPSKSVLKRWYNWYASALFQNYTDEKNTKKLTPISYDYVILQDCLGNLSDTANFNSCIKKSKASLSRDFYKDTWKGGLCRVIYELRNNGAAHGRTKYVINALYSPLKENGKNGEKVDTLLEAERMQNKIDNQAVKLKDTLANGFKVPGDKTFALGGSDVKVAYTGDVMLSYLHDTKGKNAEWKASSLSTVIQSDRKHPKLAASVMQAATIYRTIYGKQPSNQSFSNVPRAYNICKNYEKESEEDNKKDIPDENGYTFVKNNIATLYKYVQKYGTTTKAAWK